MNTETRFPAFFVVFAIIIATCFVMDLSLEVKVAEIFGMNFTPGNFLFLMTYIADDAITELYGYARARFVMWITFFVTIIAVCVYQFGVALPPAPDAKEMGAAFDTVFSMGPRMLAAILISYIACSSVNSYIVSSLKIKFKGKFFKTRALASSMVGRFFDVTLFNLIAYFGILDINTIFSIMISTVIIHTTIEITTLPITSKIVSYIKRVEGSDAYDVNVSYNPFTMKI